MIPPLPIHRKEIEFELATVLVYDQVTYCAKLADQPCDAEALADFEAAVIWSVERERETLQIELDP